MLKPSLFLLRLTLALALVAPLQAKAEMPVITGLSVEVGEGDAESIHFLTRSEVTPIHAFTLPNPDRIAIDIPKANGVAAKLPANYSGRLLKAVRFGQFNKDVSRIVLDLNYPVTVKEVIQGSPFGLEIAPKNPLPEAAAQMPPVRTQNMKQSPQAVGKQVIQKPEPVKEKPLIAVDAGHGGQDPGALGVHETHEKDVTLNFAKHLAEALVKTGRYRAKLIRDDDHFVMLGERVNIARRAKADLFISFHADSNPNPDARGLSIYTLSATASDATAAALAERENKSDIITGLDLNTTDQDVANILIDLTQRETMNKSLTLADMIVGSMGPKINKLEGTHRFAGFRVLKAPDVPSVLIELGFLTNPTDERLLLSPDYRDLVVNSVVKGVDHYYAAQ